MTSGAVYGLHVFDVREVGDALEFRVAIRACQRSVARTGERVRRHAQRLHRTVVERPREAGIAMALKARVVRPREEREGQQQDDQQPQVSHRQAAATHHFESVPVSRFEANRAGSLAFDQRSRDLGRKGYVRIVALAAGGAGGKLPLGMAALALEILVRFVQGQAGAGMVEVLAGPTGMARVAVRIRLGEVVGIAVAGLAGQAEWCFSGNPVRSWENSGASLF